VGLLREEGCGFFQDFPLFPKDAIFTAEAAELDALFGRQPVGPAAGATSDCLT